MQAVVFADAEDRHDMGVMQLSRGASFAEEPLDLPRTGVGPRSEDLECNATAERFLLGLVDNAHAAPTYLPEDPVVGQPLERSLGSRSRPAIEVADGRLGFRPESFDHDQGREQVADLHRPFRMPGDVLANRGPLSPALAIQKLFREFFKGIAFVAGVGHQQDSHRGGDGGSNDRAGRSSLPEAGTGVQQPVSCVGHLPPWEGSAESWVFARTALSRSMART